MRPLAASLLFMVLAYLLLGTCNLSKAELPSDVAPEDSLKGQDNPSTQLYQKTTHKRNDISVYTDKHGARHMVVKDYMKPVVVGFLRPIPPEALQTPLQQPSQVSPNLPRHLPNHDVFLAPDVVPAPPPAIVPETSKPPAP